MTITRVVVNFYTNMNIGGRKKNSSKYIQSVASRLGVSEFVRMRIVKIKKIIKSLKQDISI